MWDVVAVTVLLALLVYGFHPIKRWRYRHIPGPRPHWLLGNLAELVGKGQETAHAEWGQRYGPVFLVWMGGIPTVVVDDPEYARKVLLKQSTRHKMHNMHMPGSEYERLDDNGPVFGNGEHWRVARNAWAPFFSAESLERFQSLMARSTDKLCGVLDQAADTGRQVDLWREFGRLTMDVVGTCAFGVDFHTLDESAAGAAASKGLGRVQTPADRLLAAVRTLFDNFGLANAAFALFYLFPEAEIWIKVGINAASLVGVAQGRVRDKQARGTLREVASELIAAARAQQAVRAKQEQERGQQPASDAPAGKQRAPASGRLGPVDPGSFLYLMTRAADRGAAARPDLQLDDVWIASQAITFLGAGYETTANALSYCAYLLATHPDKEARLLQELHALASGSGGGGGAEAGQSAAAAYASLDLEARAPYLAAVWSEALRLYPPGTIAVRLSRPGLDLGGLALPAGSNVQVSIYSMQRSRRYWNDALDFRPERFLPGAPEALAPPPGAFLPFGDGARKCIGYKFATQEGLLALAAIYTRFTFRLEPGQVPLRVRTMLTMGPVGGVRVTVQRRQQLA